MSSICRAFFLILPVSLALGLYPVSVLAEAPHAAELPVLFHIDSSHSSVEFEVPFMGITRVSGRFDRFMGSISYDPSEMSRSSVQFVLDASSIDTDNRRRDADLVSDQFFDVENHAGIFFSSSRIEQRPTGWVAIGHLTMKGISQRIELPFEILGEHKDERGHEMGLEVGPVTLSRAVFEIGELSEISPDRLFVGDEVEVEILLRLRAVTADRLKWIAKYPEIPLKEEAALSYEGSYSSTDQADATAIRYLGRHLTLTYNGKLYALVPIGDHRFRTVNLEALVEFFTNESGPSRFILQREGRPGWAMQRNLPD
jgi:polyisoprenoid-binding protein YceI